MATLGDKVSNQDKIVVNGQKIIPKKSKTLLLAFHKPAGVECTLNEMEKTKTLIDFDFGKQRVFPIGRLDKNSRGLLLLTNDGDLCHQISHPSFEHEKEYLVTVESSITPAQIKDLKNGIIISNGLKTNKCEVELITSNTFRIVLKEGRNRQIRKMCEAIELQVTDLIRIRINNIYLGDLPVGKHRVLSSAEEKKLSEKKKRIQKS